MGNRTWLVIPTFIISLIIFSVTSAGNTAFNHFTLLADSFIHGKIYIEGDMPWLEKIPIDQNKQSLGGSTSKFYVANPPMPAVISMLPVYLFGKDLPQQYISFFIGALVVSVTVLISLKIKNDFKLAIWSAILVGFGTINWYLTTVGSTWYLAQVVAELFLLLAIYSQLKQKNPILIGLFIGFAYFSRIPTILSLPFFLFNLPKPFLKNALLLLIGLLPSVIANFAYNYARFGVVWDIGYTMIPGVATEPWYQKGVLHPSYIVNHLKIILSTIPSISNEFPYLKPSMFGYAIWFTTPAFIFAFYNKFKHKIVWSAWLAITFISFIIFSHGSTGFSQFGYRFAADFYPILIFLTISGVKNSSGPKIYHWLILFLGVIVNFWGVLFLNILRW